jgi:hypothetical protein
VQPPAPEEVVALARARSDARAARDFAAADRLRAQIEAAGWRIVDRGLEFELEPARPPDSADGARVRYGASASVPSRLGEPPAASATVVLVATDWPDDLARALGGLRAHLPVAAEVVIVADDPSPAQAAALNAVDVGLGRGEEIIWTSARLGHAAALNAAVRRAAGEVVVIVDTSVEASGDIVTPLLAGLADPGVAVAGGWGLVSADLRHFQEAPPGDVTAVEGYALAFHRADYVARGPLDERFRFYRNLDIWWSLVLRDEGEDVPPRRAVAVPLPAVRHEHRGWTSTPEAERDRLSRRNFYRVIDRFGRRGDLAVGTS